MKKLAFILGVFIIISCSRNIERQPKYHDFKNDWEKDNLFGEIKSLEQYKANIKDLKKNIFEEPIIVFKKEYTTFGKIAFQEHFDNFGKTEYSIRNEYSAKFQVIKSITECSSMSMKSIQTNEYDAKGRVALAIYTMNDTMHNTTKFEFDSLDNIVKANSIQNNDTSIVIFNYKYNYKKQILLKTQIQMTNAGNTESTNTFIYDNSGNLLESVYNYKMDAYSMSIKTAYEYDKMNRILKITEYKSGKIEKETSFDKYYNPILIKQYSQGTPDREIKYDYNFDSHGNWITRKAYIKEYNGKIDNIIHAYDETRKIFYY